MVLKAVRADAELRIIAADSAGGAAGGEGEADGEGEANMAEEQGEEENLEEDECVEGPVWLSVPGVPAPVKSPVPGVSPLPAVPESWKIGVADAVGELEKTDLQVALELHETFVAADGGTPSSWDGYGSSQALAGGSQGSGHQKSEGLMAVVEAILSDKLPEKPAKNQPDEPEPLPEPPATQPEQPADQPPGRAPDAVLHDRVMHLRQLLAEKKLA